VINKAALEAVMKKEYIFGALINSLLLLAYAFSYQVVLRELVIASKRWSFLGDGWFFVVLYLLLPIFFLIKRKWRTAVGALLGILVYALVGFLIMFTAGVA